MPKHDPQPHSTTGSRAGTWFLFFIGLSLAAIGAVFIFLMARSYLRAREMRSWPSVPCLILVSEIESRSHDPYSPREHSHNLTFGYEWKGQRKTSDLFTLRGRSWSSDPAKARQQAEAYPPGTRTTCLVNPDNPDIAVLKPDSLAPGYSIWFPGLFVLAGSVISLRALRKPDKSTLRSAH